MELSSGCTKKNVDLAVLSEWKSRILYEVRAKIGSLKTSFCHRKNKVLDDVEVIVLGQGEVEPALGLHDLSLADVA